MASTISNRLARLIRERAYLSGEIDRTQQKVEGLDQEIVALRERQRALQEEIEDQQAKLHAIDTKIREEASSIDPNDIQSMKLTPRHAPGRHGDLVKALIEMLKIYPGISTLEMADRVAVEFGYPMGTPSQRNVVRERVKHGMHALRNKGAVERLPSKTGAKGQKVACWKWIGDDAS